MKLRFWWFLAWCACGEIAVVFPADDAGAPPCSTSRACRSPLVCDASGECVECVTDANCSAPSPACDPVSQRCVACRGTLGCTAPYVCSPTAPFCVLPCTDGSSGSCPGFIESCRSNVCSSCNEDEDCALGTFCDPPHGRCVACLSDANCSGATPRCNQGRGVCEACLRNTDCPAGGTCFQGSCRAPF